jgi:hypothetical protein
MNTDAIYQAILVDRQLEAAADISSEELARHRWHWTLDPSNPDRSRGKDGTDRGAVSEYAKRVGRSQNVIYAQAHGYSLKAINPDMPLQEAIARAATGAERAEVVEAVAAATGKSFQNVVKNNAQLASSVHRAARERAERKGTTVSQELPRAAESVVASQEAAKNERKAKRASKSHQLLVLEGHLASAQLALKYALRDESVNYSLLAEDDREYLGSVIARLRDMLNLLDLRVTDTADVDWDAELAKLGES